MKREAAQQNRDEMLRFLDEYGVVDKDLRSKQQAALAPQQSPQSGRQSGHGKRVTIDLHGLRQTEASRLLRDTIDDCAHSGVRELLIIHGYGLHSSPDEGPVLKTLVVTMLERECHYAIKNYRPALPREGGAGATVVRLR